MEAFSAKAWFQLTLPEWGATAWHYDIERWLDGFNSRSPSGERPSRRWCQDGNRRFNSRSPSGERPGTPSTYAVRSAFQLTLPEWGATRKTTRLLESAEFQLTLPEWGATTLIRHPCRLRGFNSRSPSGERPLGQCRCSARYDVSTHAPRVGSDPRETKLSPPKKFQLTLPEWGATQMPVSAGRPKCRFNSRSPSGERPLLLRDSVLLYEFQLTLPEWGATIHHPPHHRAAAFQLTLPEWGATSVISVDRAHLQVSTHAPRVGSDIDQVRSVADGFVSTHAPRVGSD